MYLDLKHTFLLILIASMVLNGIFTLSDKLGALEWIICRVKNNFLAKMLDCDFCLSHHLTLIATIPLLIYDFKLIYLLIPISVAGIINQLR